VPRAYDAAKRRFKLAISQDDIDRAMPANSRKCAIARALATQYPVASSISVDVATIRFTMGDRRYYYMTPPAAQRFIIHFDMADSDVKPFDCVLQEGTSHAVAHRPGGKRPGHPEVVSGHRVPSRDKHVRAYGARAFSPAAREAAEKRRRSNAG